MNLSNLIIPIALIIFSTFVYIKYKDKNYLWIFILSIIFLIVSIIKPGYHAIGIIYGVFVISLIYWKDIKYRHQKEFERNIEGFPQQLSLNSKFIDFSEKDKYPYCLVIGIEIKEENSQGLPSDKKEEKYLRFSEKSIFEKIKTVADYYFIGRASYKGTRYLYAYVSDETKIVNLFKQSPAPDQQPKNFTYEITEDREWKKLLQYFNVSK